jgi:hypothetical protein
VKFSGSEDNDIVTMTVAARMESIATGIAVGNGAGAAQHTVCPSVYGIAFSLFYRNIAI